MAGYRLTIKRSAEKALRAIPQEDVRRVVARMEALSDDPRPPGSEKLSAREQYRIRQGDYRIMYTIDDRARIVDVVRIAHRGDAYR